MGKGEIILYQPNESIKLEVRLDRNFFFCYTFIKKNIAISKNPLILEISRTLYVF